MKKLLLILLILIPIFLHAQVEDLTKDLTFFEEQTENYQRWLDNSGLGELLSVADIKVEQERLSLYLKFPFEEIDAVMNAWKQLKQDFETQSTLTLEQALFYKAVHFMAVRQSMVDVQLYDTYDLKKEPLFMRAIYFEDEKVKVEANNPKSDIKDVQIKPVNFRGLKKPSLEELRAQYSREQVFDLILQYAKTRFNDQLYEDTDCSGRYPKLRLLEQGEVLRFEVTDLCREVLEDAQNPFVCEILQRFISDCNWVRREKLEFIFTYTPTEEGFVLGGEVDGKYGSGRYDRVPRGGYYSMEVDFDDYLTDYADELSTILRTLIVNRKP